MLLQAIKLTKENLPTIVDTIGANPESLKLLTSMRDKYVLFDPEATGTERNWSVVDASKMRKHFTFAEPEANRFIEVTAN